MEVCLFGDLAEVSENRRALLHRRGDGLWHGYLPDVEPGTLYGYRAEGPWAPERGQRYNPAKLLIDPWARDVVGELRWVSELFHRGPDGERHPGNSAPFVPRGRVVDETFDWQSVPRPGTPWRDTVIYETHVAGHTRLHPEVPESLRGTYLGLASPAVIRHFKELGVTAVELLPVAHRISEHGLQERGLSNYWGYNPLGFFAPDRRFAATDDAVAEFKTMVRELHRAGLEVFLDVVFNHTAEGDQDGPTLGLKGLDYRGYYRLDPEAPQRHVDLSGCGNTPDIRFPAFQRLVLDCLRYWVQEMGVDGFRFDLAPTLGRSPGIGFDPQAPFFRAIAEDPALRGVKWIAEPWDLGPGGYQQGGFPAPWSCWNDRFRDDLRAFWRGDEGMLPRLASRLAGSSEIYSRGPGDGVNYVTAHDGFTLYDLVSFESRRNHANGEDNRDGHGNNLSRNWGVEGPSRDPRIVALRNRVRRAFFATLALSQGVPMLSHGDEVSRSQQGNNNAYCHDSPLTWIHWKVEGEDRLLAVFLREALRIRRQWPIFRRRHFFRGHRPGRGADILWLRPDGLTMTSADWHERQRRVLGAFLPDGCDDGEGNSSADHRHPCNCLVLLFNGSQDDFLFRLPPAIEARSLAPLLDSARFPEVPIMKTPLEVVVAAHSVLVLAETASHG